MKSETSKNLLITGVSLGIIILSGVLINFLFFKKESVIENKLPEYVLREKSDNKAVWKKEGVEEPKVSTLWVDAIKELTKDQLERLSGINQYVQSGNDFVSKEKIAEYKEKMDILSKELVKYKAGNVFRVNPTTGKEYSSETEFIKERLKILPNEIDSTKSELNTQKSNKTEVQKRLTQLLAEKSDLENQKAKTWIYYSDSEVRTLVSQKEIEIGALSKDITQFQKIVQQKAKYITYLKGTTSSFDINEVFYIQTALGNNIPKDNTIKIDLNDANKIISQFDGKTLSKVTQNLAVGITVNSDALYAKINKVGKDIYVDESVYLRLKLSIKNGFTDYLLVKSSPEFEIYTFVSGFDSKKWYFDSIMSNLLRLNEDIVSNFITFNSQKDIKEKGILKEYLKYVRGEKQNEKYPQGLYLEVLKNFL